MYHNHLQGELFHTDSLSFQHDSFVCSLVAQDIRGHSGQGCINMKLIVGKCTQVQISTNCQLFLHYVYVMKD